MSKTQTIKFIPTTTR